MEDVPVVGLEGQQSLPDVHKILHVTDLNLQRQQYRPYICFLFALCWLLERWPLASQAFGSVGTTDQCEKGILLRAEQGQRDKVADVNIKAHQEQRELQTGLINPRVCTKAQ